MPRIQPIDTDQAEGQTKSILDGVRKKVGMVPNLYATMANSPAVLDAYLSFNKAMSSASLPASLREQIALTVAGANGCDYCASAHTAIGSKLGVDRDELTSNLGGTSGDTKVQAGLTFAKAIIESEGWVSDDDLTAVRSAGYTEAEVAEIVAAVALNVFSNYFNHVAGTEIDFPFVSSNRIDNAAV